MKSLNFLNAKQYCIGTDGSLFSLRTNSLMRGWLDVAGYKKYSITFDDGTRKEFPAHRLVALAYIDNPEDKEFVNHINGIKTDNRVENLEWVTASENNFHAYDTGLSLGKKPKADVPTLKGEYTESAIDYTEDDIRAVCELISKGYRDVDISRMLDFPRRPINLIRHNEFPSFKDIISEYDFNFCKEDRMSPEMVILICEELANGAKVMELSRKLGLNRKKIGNIHSRKTFKDISKSFKW